MMISWKLYIGCAILVCMSTSAALLDFFGASAFEADSNPGTAGLQAFANNVDYTAGTFRWRDITNDGGTSLDLVATITGGTYRAANAANNGVIGQFGRLNQSLPNDVSLQFRLVDAMSADAPVIVNTFNFAVLDLDTGSSVAGLNIEYVELEAPLPDYSYTVTTTTELNLIPSVNATRFEATVLGDGADNPTDPNNLTAQQEDRTVRFSFYNTSGFTMTLGTTGPATFGRNFLFAGSAIFDDNLVINGGPVPEPGTTGLLIVLLSAGVWAKRRRRHQDPT